ncbi:MAG: glutamate 5-kinase [Candidatus Omnitrophica bacterium]|nr:glutamate 5-kinase [Candidatus Omnitrophota bacterium]
MNMKIARGAKIVIKVGSSILTDKDGKIDRSRFKMISEQICQLKQKGYALVLVSSEAIACGMQRLGYRDRPQATIYSSSAAAVGQSLLMHNYEQLFQEKNYISAQLLLTSDGLHDRERYLNSRNTLLNLLENGNIIPVVNENDAVVTEEIKFGDNDRLSAQVAALIDAQVLIILSDVDGVYDKQGHVIPKISEIDSFVRDLATDTSKKTSVGGMITKLDAAKTALNAGIILVVANGSKPGILEQIIAGNDVGTWFLPTNDKLSGKKRWIAFSCKNCGKIIIDQGAKKAVMEERRSLLAIGVLKVEGTFSFGDLVIVCDQDHNEIARGLVNYSNIELEKIKGKKTDAISAILGYKLYDEVIHRDNLVVLR